MMQLTMDTPPLANTWGFIALVCYSLTLLPTILRIVFPKTKGTLIHRELLRHRRSIGIMSFLFSALHGYPYLQQRNLDARDVMTYLIYIQGVLAFIVLALLAMTSHDWMIKKLKKNWKRLHRLTYVLMFILIWHIWDKMSGHWTYLTPLGLGVTTGVTTLFLIRAYLELTTKHREASKTIAAAAGKDP
jgi:methionine sulfoxide reductase heme-binding subunit